jgi:DNA-binding XRE family transcriptional regulator
MSLSSPKNPYRVEINFDKALAFGNVLSYTGESIESVMNLAKREIQRLNASAYVRIWHNDAGFPDFDWRLEKGLYFKANGTEDVSRNIGTYIAQLRREAGLTQTQLADKCGMAQPNIARIEAGTYATSIDVLSRIAEALGKRIELV